HFRSILILPQRTLLSLRTRLRLAALVRGNAGAPSAAPTAIDDPFIASDSVGAACRTGPHPASLCFAVTGEIGRRWTEVRISLSAVVARSERGTADSRWHDATPTQQGIWILDQDERLRPTYLIPLVLEFTGTVEHAVLVESVQRAVGRHPALRSRFRLDTRCQRVQYRTSDPPATTDFLDAAGDGWSTAEVARLVELLCWTPFDLAAEAPARATVIRVPPRPPLLVRVTHPIVFDGWSRQLLVDEITTIYQAATQGREPRLRAPGHPADVLSAAPRAGLAEHTAQVVRRLRGAPTDIDLPYRPRPAAAQPPLPAPP